MCVAPGLKLFARSVLRATFPFCEAMAAKPTPEQILACYPHHRSLDCQEEAQSEPNMDEYDDAGVPTTMLVNSIENPDDAGVPTTMQDAIESAESAESAVSAPEAAVSADDSTYWTFDPDSLAAEYAMSRSSDGIETPQQQESRRLVLAFTSDTEIRAWMRQNQTPEQIRAQERFWHTPPPPPPTIELLAQRAGYERTPVTGDFFRTVPTGNYRCVEFSAPPSRDGGGTWLGRLDKNSWLQALEVRVVLIPGDQRRADPEYGIAIRVTSQCGAEDGMAWVNVSRNDDAYASLGEQITVLHDGGTHRHRYLCCMSDLVSLEDETPGFGFSLQ